MALPPFTLLPQHRALAATAAAGWRAAPAACRTLTTRAPSVIAVDSPYTQQTIAEVPVVTGHAAKKAVATAVEVQASAAWKGKTLADRCALVNRYITAVLEDKDAIAKVRGLSPPPPLPPPPRCMSPLCCSAFHSRPPHVSLGASWDGRMWTLQASNCQFEHQQPL